MGVDARIDRQALLRFLGFGNPDADVVFIGMEEGLTVPPPLEEQLVERSRFPKLIDLAESARVHAGRFFSVDKPPIQPTWNLMIRLMLALEGSRSPSLDELRFYQRNRLGRSHERAALLEMLPLPSPSVGEWPYAAIFPEYQTRESYRRDQLPKRIGLLRSHLRYGPRLVIAYGSSYWDDYKSLFSEAGEWTSAGPFQFARTDKTAIILTPHFTARQMNGNRDALVALAIEQLRG